MPMTAEERRKSLMDLDKEALVEWVADGIDKIWILTERIIYICESISMPAELIREALDMDEDIFNKVMLDVHNEWEKMGVNMPKSEIDEDGVEVIVLDLRQH
jgi:hypothetical protein